MCELKFQSYYFDRHQGKDLNLNEKATFGLELEWMRYEKLLIKFVFLFESKPKIFERAVTIYSKPLLPGLTWFENWLFGPQMTIFV